MKEAFQKFIKQEKLLKPGNKTLLAVSGGVDSVVMCDLFSQSNLPFKIAHCNFGLRGKESDDDELFVRELSKKYSAAFYSKRFDTQKVAEANKLSIQEAARDLRYSWFLQLLKEKKLDRIATAHHLDDSIETYFINMLRGSGPDGLKGIPVINGKIIRPLLFSTRGEIEHYAGERNLSWRNDSSNQGDDYLRNRIRHQLVPLLKELQPSLIQVMKQNMKHMELCAEALKDWTKEKLDIKKSRGIEKISLTTKPGSIVYLLFEYLKHKGFTLSQAEDISSAISRQDSGQLFYSADAEILKDRNQLIVRTRKKKPAKEYHVSPAMKSLNIPGGQWIMRKDKIGAVKVPMDSASACLDFDKLLFPLTARPWQEGEYFFPLGMKGRKKISDFLIDHKISRFDKENIFVLLSRNNIVCILGHRIDERYKVTSNTKNVLLIEPEKK